MPASPSANSPLPPLPLRGGCLCGQVRYAIAPLPSQTSIIDAGYCHCRLCQRASGAPVVAWATVRRAALHMLAGTGTTYASSAKGRRTFCPRCGTALFFTHADQPDTVDITLASLDDPAALTPAYHIWTQQRQPWLALHDALPRYMQDEDGPLQHAAAPAADARTRAANTPDKAASQAAHRQGAPEIAEPAARQSTDS